MLNIPQRKLPFQDVAKAGLKFGDEGEQYSKKISEDLFTDGRYQDLDLEEEKAQQKMLAQKFQPLLAWLKEKTGDVVRDGKLQLFHVAKVIDRDLLKL